MWIYEKKLQFPVKIKTPDPAAAKIIISQLGGPDGELAASMRYLHQRFSMPYREIAGVLTDVGAGDPERHPSGTDYSRRNSFLSLSRTPSFRSLLISAERPLRSTSR